MKLLGFLSQADIRPQHAPAKASTPSCALAHHQYAKQQEQCPGSWEEKERDPDAEQEYAQQPSQQALHERCRRIQTARVTHKAQPVGATGLVLQPPESSVASA